MRHSQGSKYISKYKNKNEGFYIINFSLIGINNTRHYTQADEEALGVFERRILRAIYGPTKEGEVYRIRHNHELYQLFQDADIVTVLRVNRLRWAGHVNRRSQDAPVFKVTFADFVDGKRSRGRPKNTWIGCVDKDARVLNIPNWQKLSKDRAVYRRSLNAAMGPRAPQPRK